MLNQKGILKNPKWDVLNLPCIKLTFVIGFITMTFNLLAYYVSALFKIVVVKTSVGVKRGLLVFVAEIGGGLERAAESG